MKVKISITIVLLFVFFSCKKDNRNAPPDIAIFSINLWLHPIPMESYLLYPEGIPPSLGTPMETGTAGIIIYNSSIVGYVAKVVPDNAGFAECPFCHSRYNLSIGDGQVATGPAEKSLWVYPDLRTINTISGPVLQLNYFPEE